MSAVKNQVENATHEKKLVGLYFVEQLLKIEKNNKTGPYKACYSDNENVQVKKSLETLLNDDWGLFGGVGVKIYSSTFRGNIVLSVESDDGVVIFTPRGVRPYDLPVIGGTADSLIKYCNKSSGFELKKLGLAGAFVAHGTDMEKAKSIITNGIDMSCAVKGSLGKAFYLTPNYKYALNNYAKELGRVDDKNAVVMLAQIDPSAKIVIDGDGKKVTDDVLNNLGRDDAVAYMLLKGVDGIFIPSTNELAVFNTSVVKFLGAFDADEIKAAEKKDISLSMSP